MDDFTAPKGGYRIHRSAVGNGYMDLRSGNAPRALHEFSPQEFESLREFFQAEEDERLGRWRWPENPSYVVYEAFSPGEEKRFARVVHEHTGVSSIYYEGSARGQDENEIAAAYFYAHPEPEPIPNEPRTAWVDKYGTDVWVVGADGVIRCVFSPSSDPAKYAPFTRLVPEVSS